MHQHSASLRARLMVTSETNKRDRPRFSRTCPPPGLTKQPGEANFDGFELLGDFDDSFGYEVRTFAVVPPMNAKFLAIHSTSGKKITVCFIEVY